MLEWWVNWLGKAGGAATGLAAALPVLPAAAGSHSPLRPARGKARPIGCQREGIVDPLSTALRMALLQYEPPNTKVLVRSYHVELDPPAFLQPLTRFQEGASKETDVPFLRTILTKGTARLELRNPDIRHVLRAAVIGLRGLQRETYVDSELVKDDIDKSISHINHAISQAEERARNGNATDSDSFSDIDCQDDWVQQFRHLWRPEQIRLATGLLQEVQKAHEDGCIEEQHLFKVALNAVLRTKDVRVEALVHERVKSLR